MNPSDLQPLILSGALVATVAFALFSTKVSSSLIALFYSSVILAVIFTISGDALLGLVQMATFAGAVSVLTLSVILMTGESRLGLGVRKLGLAAVLALVAFAAAAFYAIKGGPGSPFPGSYTDLSNQVLTLLWVDRPWDLLILVMAFASAMVTISNLMSREP
jgi:NADH:ubiquinone oxidoreductase subunit 6 (subunit J)